MLLKAFADVQGSIKLVLLTKQNEQLDQLIHSMNLTERVIVAGFQKNPYPWMRHAKLSVLSSDSGEALGMVLIESLICGTPVVSTDCPSGPSEILTGSLAKWLVPVNDAKALSKKIQEALATDISIDERLIKKFKDKYVMKQYEELMETA